MELSKKIIGKNFIIIDVNDNQKQKNKSDIFINK